MSANGTRRKHWVVWVSLLGCCLQPGWLAAQAHFSRKLSGVIMTRKNEVVGGILITAATSSGELKTVSDADGSFHLMVPKEGIRIIIEGKNVEPQEKILGIEDATENLEVIVEFRIPPIHESLVITAQALEPEIDRRNDAVYKNTLFGRDDQLLFTLDAGINAGQHEGGG